MIDQSFILDQLTELGANFSKTFSKAQIKLIMSFVDKSKINGNQFKKRINELMKYEYFPRNLKLAFSFSAPPSECIFSGCSIKKDESPWCKWHKIVHDRPEQNTISRFNEWRNDEADYLDSIGQSKLKFLKYYTWNNTLNSLNIKSY